MSKSGRVTSSFLRNISNRVEIDAHVRELQETIDATILRAHRSGFNSVCVEMPTNLVVTNMEKSDVEALVFSEIIDTYKKSEEDGGRGFDNTYLTRKGEQIYLNIRWVNGMSATEREARKQIIKDALVIPSKNN